MRAEVRACVGRHADAAALAKRSMEDSLSAEQYLELLLGARGESSAFDSPQARRAAWQAHRAELLRLVEPGSRPWAWWAYDAPEPVLPRETDLVYLTRCRLLTQAERASLEPAETQRASHATRKP